MTKNQMIKEKNIDQYIFMSFKNLCILSFKDKILLNITDVFKKGFSIILKYIEKENILEIIEKIDDNNFKIIESVSVKNIEEVITEHFKKYFILLDGLKDFKNERKRQKNKNRN